MSTTARFFYRCADCLGVFAHAQQLQQQYIKGFGLATATCGACGGSVEFMGRAQRDRLVKDELRCPCDERCTNAPGPSCNCRCGGENHGSGLLIEVTVDAGKLPTAQLPEAPKHAKAAAEYRSLADVIQAEISARYGDAMRRKAAREYLGADAFDRFLKGDALSRRLRAARQQRSHHTRNKALRQIIGEMGLQDPTAKPVIAHVEHFTTTLPAPTTTGKQVSLFDFHPMA